MTETTTRDRILQESRELFLTLGLSGFSMRAVAERVGVSATAIYRHFDGKDALLAAVLREAFGTFGTYLMRALSKETPIERFRATGTAYFDFALEHPRDYQLMFMTDCKDLGYARISEQIGERGRGTFQFLVDRIEECMKAGNFPRRDTNEVALYVWSQTHGTASLWLVGQLSGRMDLSAFRRHVEFTLDRLEMALSADAALPILGRGADPIQVPPPR
jgi:AcrR family transcriptional regulator